MKASFRASMSWLHTWTGLIAGWVLFAIFITGTATVFRHEIEAWTRPSLSASFDPDASVQRAMDWSLKDHPQATLAMIQVPTAQERDMYSYWSNPDGSFGYGDLDPASGSWVGDPPTSGGELFYRFHFELMAPYPFGRFTACLAGIFFVSAVVSGVITHKKIFADFFTFRPSKGGQRAWLDGHNALGVLALPFHFLIALTGVITLGTTFLPAVVTAGYGEEAAAYYTEAAPETIGIPAPSGQAAPMAPIKPMLDAARQRLGAEPQRVLINNLNDANARVTVYRDNAGRLALPMEGAVFDGVTGQLISAPKRPGPALMVHDTLYGLHMGEFSGPILRWLYFFAGLSGCGLIVSGLVLWTVTRRRKLADPAKPYFGFRLVEVLNTGVVMGSVLAVVGFFWSSRLLPRGLEGRIEWEGRVFLLTILAGVIYSALRPQRRAWAELSAVAAALFVLTPLMSALSGGRNLARSVATGDGAMIALDLTMLLLGAAFAAVAWRAGLLGERTPRSILRTPA
jgi:uncharacterized iron-regulated membrane protein